MANTADIRDAQLENLRKAINNAKDLRSKALGQLETLQKQEEELIKECQALDVEPDQLETALELAQSEYANLLRETVSLIPWETLGIPVPR